MKKIIIILVILLAPILFFKLRTKEKYFAKDEIETPDYQYSRVSLHIFKSPYGVDWTSPKTVLLSNIKNKFSSYNRHIGHIATEIQCLNSKGETDYYNFTGMTDTGMDVVDLLLKKDLGFGIIFESHPGALEDISPLQQELASKRQEGRVQTVTIKISKASCDNLANYIKSYQEEGVHKFYGGLNYEVRYKKPAGCVHFAYSVIDIADFEGLDFFKTWMRTIYIPKSLVGGKMTGQKVSLYKMITDPHFNHWASNESDGVKIEFWDLDGIFNELMNLPKNSDVEVVDFAQGSKEYILDYQNQESFETNYWLDPI